MLRGFELSHMRAKDVLKASCKTSSGNEAKGKDMLCVVFEWEFTFKIKQKKITKKRKYTREIELYIRRITFVQIGNDSSR